MIKGITKHKLLPVILLSVLSFIAGGINGFLGTGGGIIFVYSLSALTKNEKKDNFATSLCATIPISFIAIKEYIQSSHVDFSVIRIACVPVFIGGLIGALLTDRLSVKWLNGIFACLVIYSGFRLIFK